MTQTNTVMRILALAKDMTAAEACLARDILEVRLQELEAKPSALDTCKKCDVIRDNHPRPNYGPGLFQHAFVDEGSDLEAPARLPRPEKWADDICKSCGVMRLHHSTQFFGRPHDFVNEGPELQAGLEEVVRRHTADLDGGSDDF